ncbi:Log1 protein [Saccharomycopsis crataegensis]|uniref:Log1 protein n=1 Tax=Saccharomycopsis crataegensis TaxID=43959 RepID=A0AAV5QFQ5_9ASCO|nr:Log1 protein [Saccharomycopsis crataegensis]
MTSAKMQIEAANKSVTKPEKVLCVFCGSSPGSDPAYTEAANELGKALAQRGYGLVYGGGDCGLMGSVARSCVVNNGYVHGIIPQALFDRERNAQIVDGQYGKTTVVNDMHTRKRMMGNEASSGFITLPGGYGSLEELAEVITWSQLGIHDKPVIVYNINGFFDGLKTFFEHCIDQGFIKRTQKEIVVFANTLEEVLDQIENYKIPESRYNLKWENQ